MEWWFFYILQSQKDKNFFYKGSSDNLQRRLNKHHAGYVQSTKAYNRSNSFTSKDIETKNLQDCVKKESSKVDRFPRRLSEG